MRRTRLVFLSLFIVVMLGTSVLPVAATDIYPDLLEISFEADGAFNFASGSDIELHDPDKEPVTIFDETAEAFFLRASKEDPSNFLISKEATDALARMFLVQKAQEPDLDLSFSWEFMVRLPEMPETMTFGSGYYASGGFSFCADSNYGYFLVQSASSDADAQDLYLQFPMEANKWYHCILVYDDFEQQFYAYVNGARIKAKDSNDDYVAVNPFRLSYLWHWGLQIGGSNIERKRVDLSQDIAICNIYSQIVPEADAVDIYEMAAMQWGLIPKQDTTTAPTTEATETPTATPEMTDVPTIEATLAPTVEVTESGEMDSSSASPISTPKQNGGSNAIIVVAIVAAVLVIGSGVTAGIIAIKKKK